MLRIVATLAAAFALTIPSRAQDFPARPPTIVVPFAAGGPFDIIAREVAEALTRHLGKQPVVENRPGAGGVTGARYVMAANPDGYTLLLGSPGPLVIAPIARPGTLDVEKQLVPVGIISESPQVLVVSAKMPVNSVTELVAHAKDKGGALNFGSAGIGTTPHLSAELFKKVAGIEMAHVPYRGTAAAVQDVIRGEVGVLFGDIATLKPFIESGQLRALAVTGQQRSKLVPAIPSALDAGFPDLMVRNFSALLAPTATPTQVLAILSKALADVKTDQAFLARLEFIGMAAVPSSPEHARTYLATETRTWTPVVQSAGLKP